jgi:NTP pyrophosphatase (non-canonical NTP hydrolase)
MSRFPHIRGWAFDRNLLTGSDSFRQCVKLIEEIGELAGGIARGQREKIEDGIGDAVVVLTILAAQNNMDIEDCIEAAWNEIKDRKGRMVDGVFVKEGD